MDQKEMTFIANQKSAVEGKRIYEEVNREFDQGPELNTTLLMQMLEDNKDTEYGRKYGFADIHSVEEYQKKVPVIVYEDIKEEIGRMEQGERNILTAYNYTHFNETSATSGEPKHIPMTDRQQQVFMRYNNQYLNGLKAEFLDPAWMKGRAFCTAEGKHSTLPSGLTLGDASSVMASSVRGSKETFGAMMETIFTSPLEATLPVPHTDTRYIHTRFALMDKDITGIITSFYSLVVSYLTYIAQNYEVLIDDIENGTINEDINLTEETRQSLLEKIHPMPERAAELREIFKDGSDLCFVPKVWPKIIYMIGVGMDGFSVYDSLIKNRFTGNCLKNIYSGVTASEGLWSVPGGLDTEDSVMAPGSAFFEFLPVECGDDFSKCVTMEKVEAGRVYELIVTNQCGFYRYRTSDAVEVTGFRGHTPMIRFLYRVNRTVNMVSEKTTEKALQTAVEQAVQELGVELSDFTFYPDAETLTYVFLVEPVTEDVNVSEEKLAEVLLEKMKTLNPDYAHYVAEGMVPPPKAHWLQPQTMMLYRDLQVARGASVGQTKPVRVIDSEEQKRFFFGLLLQ